MSTHISTRDLADLIGKSQSALKKAIRAIATGRRTTWHGAALRVRVVHGRGGRSGRLHEVEIASLPPLLQAKLKGSESLIQLSLNLDTPADNEAVWKEAFLRPAMSTERGTAERREAIRQLASSEQIRDGRRIMVPERTIQRWMADFDAHGLAGLRRRKRSDAGKQAVLITRAWDAATTSLSDSVRKRIAAQLAQHRRNLWGNGASYIDVKRLASEFLADATLDAGITLPDDELRAVCALPKHVIEIGRDARDVHEFRTDRKSWDDKRPRMLLTSAKLRPMGVVYGDVHHFDIYLEREDGSLATPKGIAWMDAATGRIRIDIKLCAPGAAVRNADLIDSFISMTQDPYWGVPEKLYLDNGSEYRWAEFVKDALTLTGMQCFTFGEDKRNALIRAQAYNASAKGNLEGSFRVFEETLVKVLPGYLGGNRMSSRRANVGKAPEPWPGTFDGFVSRLDDLIRYWMTRSRQGDLKGKSPQEMLAEFIAAGWERTDIDPYALAVAFSIEAARQVVDAKISAPGGKYYCDALIPYTGQKVGIRIPKYQSWDAVPVFSLKTNELIGVARREMPVDRLDPAGAEEASRRKKAAVAAIKDKATTVQPIDIAALMAASGRRQQPPPEPKSGGRIGMADALGAAGRQLAETPAEQHDREHAAKQAHMRKRLALAESIKPKAQP